MKALLCAMGESFCGECFGESSFFPECGKLVLDLSAEHHDESVAENEDAVSHNHGIIGLEPCIEVVLLIEDMDAALVLHIVLIGGFVEV